MSVLDKAQACVQRVDHGHGQALNLDGCVEAVQHPLDGCSRSDLITIIACLSAQVVGYQHRGDQNATLAVAQIARIIDGYKERTR
ncbi:MAG TPA: hypothetical protein VFJ19_09480 [Nocardioidaceae bacterium]|nr:hypothetical protein [Nocardioidaceae bacterium]